MDMILKPQDVLVLLKLVSLGSRDLSFAALAESLRMSPSEVHAGLGRARHARLYAEVTRQPIATNLFEFLVHGLKYAFPADIGSKTRGIPTSYAAPPLKDALASVDEPLPPVWPSPDGTVAGLSFSPLYQSAPLAAGRDRKLYELLVLVDAIRSGRVREQRIATELLQDRLDTEKRSP